MVPLTPTSFRSPSTPALTTGVFQTRFSSVSAEPVIGPYLAAELLENLPRRIAFTEADLGQEAVGSIYYLAIQSELQYLHSLQTLGETLAQWTPHNAEPARQAIITAMQQVIDSAYTQLDQPHTLQALHGINHLVPTLIAVGTACGYFTPAVIQAYVAHQKQYPGRGHQPLPPLNQTNQALVSYAKLQRIRMRLAQVAGRDLIPAREFEELFRMEPNQPNQPPRKRPTR